MPLSEQPDQPQPGQFEKWWRQAFYEDLSRNLRKEDFGADPQTHISWLTQEGSCSRCARFLVGERLRKPSASDP